MSRTRGFSSRTNSHRAAQLKWVHTSAVAVETLCLDRVVRARRRRQQHARRAGRADCRACDRRGVGACQAAAIRARPSTPGHVGAESSSSVTACRGCCRGRTLGVIGVGTIGSEIAARARALACAWLRCADALGSRCPVTRSQSTAAISSRDLLGAVRRAGHCGAVDRPHARPDRRRAVGAAASRRHRRQRRPRRRSRHRRAGRRASSPVTSAAPRSTSFPRSRFRPIIRCGRRRT